MALSASIPVLKSKARKLRRAEGIRLSEALDRVARAEGFESWSLLASRANARGEQPSPEVELGDLVLVGARPGQGKTAWAMKTLVQALRQRRRGWFFSLLNDAPNLNAMFAALGEQPSSHAGSFVFDDSDDICARYIIDRVSRFATAGAVVVIDHLQLLDQRRRFPELQQQVGELRAFAKASGCIVIFILQIASSFDRTGELMPTVRDVRLPNALDLAAFDRLLFLHDGRHRLHMQGERGSPP